MVATMKRRDVGKPAVGPASASMVKELARQLQSWAGSVLGQVGTATDMTLWIARNKVKAPAAKAALGKTQSLLRELRLAAGLTRDDVSKALKVEDRSFLALVESGQVASLPFDLILRLAAILGRNDPLPVVLQMTRVYNPKTWKTLEALGVGKLYVQAGREREFANIYRSHDAARALSDKEFAAALGVANAAFESALESRPKHTRRARPGAQTAAA